MLTLTGIRIYPVKSLGGVQRTRARILSKGLEYDRRWMLVDANSVCMTQREYPRMAMFGVNDAPAGFTISIDGEAINLPHDRTTGGDPLKVQIWDDHVIAREVSPVFSKWFSDRLDVACRLVEFPESNVRQIDPRFASTGMNVSLADAFPLLVIGEASLADLNSRLREPLAMERFRPNLIVGGGQPFEEDLWDEFSVGSNLLRGVKRCARCAIPTIDPATGKKGAEPLRTLATYRRENNKIFFGQNVLTQGEGDIKAGDAIEVIMRHDIAPDLKTTTPS